MNKPTLCLCCSEIIDPAIVDDVHVDGFDDDDIICQACMEALLALGIYLVEKEEEKIRQERLALKKCLNEGGDLL